MDLLIVVVISFIIAWFIMKKTRSTIYAAGAFIGSFFLVPLVWSQVAVLIAPAQTNPPQGSSGCSCS